MNKLYEETMDKIKTVFMEKYEKLQKEEKELKDNLQEKVKSIENQLDHVLSLTNNQIKIGENLNKEVIKIENNEKEILEKIFYISNINKNKKDANKLLNEAIKSLKFSYKEKNYNKIEYEEYYFNGLEYPQFVILNPFYSFINLSWHICGNYINIDKKKIKFRVEMRKENENIFKQIYEGDNTFYSITNLSDNTDYEFRMCSFYNDIKSKWTDIQKIKTIDVLDSSILNDCQRKKEFISKILEWSGYDYMELKFRGSTDGMMGSRFHKKCDHQGKTITLIQNDRGDIFGGFASIPWTNNFYGSYRKAPDSFIFTLTNIHNTEPTKFPNTNDGKEVYHKKKLGPIFGNEYDIYISNDFLQGNNYSTFPSSYKDVLGKGKSVFTGDIDNNNQKIIIKEIEVFELCRHNNIYNKYGYIIEEEDYDDYSEFEIKFKEEIIRTEVTKEGCKFIIISDIEIHNIGKKNFSSLCFVRDDEEESSDNLDFVHDK